MSETISIERHKELLAAAIAMAVDETRRLCNSITQVEEPVDIHVAASYLNISVSRIYNLVSEGGIPHYKKGGLYFFKSELSRWIKSGKSKKVLRHQQVETLLKAK